MTANPSPLPFRWFSHSLSLSFLFIFFFSGYHHGYAQRRVKPYDLSLGIRIGEPGGADIKYFVSPNVAMEICLGQSGGVYWRKDIIINDTLYESSGVKGWVTTAYLMNSKAMNLAGFFQFYYGAGFQALYYGGPGTKVVAIKRGTALGEVEPFVIVSAGPLVGVEYAFEYNPLILSLDLMPVLELISDARGLSIRAEEWVSGSVSDSPPAGFSAPSPLYARQEFCTLRDSC